MGIQSSRPGGGFADAGIGTSFAAPHVSGLAALLLDEDATRTPDQVREFLVARCKALGTKNKNVEGAGRVKI
jgi:serine protease AprX